VMRFEGWMHKAWTEISAKGDRQTLEGLDLEADKDWGINFFQGAAHGMETGAPPRILFEFERLPKMSGNTMPSPGTLYVDPAKHAFKRVWRAVDFRDYPPSRVFVKDADVDAVRVQFRLAAWNFPVEVGSKTALQPGAYYHSQPVEGIPNVLRYGALLSESELIYRRILSREAGQALFCVDSLSDLSASQSAQVREAVHQILAGKTDLKLAGKASPETTVASREKTNFDFLRTISRTSPEFPAVRQAVIQELRDRFGEVAETMIQQWNDIIGPTRPSLESAQDWLDECARMLDFAARILEPDNASWELLSTVVEEF